MTSQDAPACSPTTVNSLSRSSEAIRFPNVIVWFGLGVHELRLAAGEMGVVRLLVSLVEVAGAVGARSA
ncbi:hypothetical protein ACFXKI_55320, partial [Streptomyces mirabilis]|uniref:hypothetical protein n=1 Tax=Streptomyces mirabilis TaxID=68239 RepID=UPI00368654F8